jgi:hypothetical protein
MSRNARHMRILLHVHRNAIQTDRVRGLQHCLSGKGKAKVNVNVNVKMPKMIVGMKKKQKQKLTAIRIRKSLICFSKRITLDRTTALPTTSALPRLRPLLRAGAK